MKQLITLILFALFTTSLFAADNTGAKAPTNDQWKPIQVSSKATIWMDDMNGDNSVAGLEARGYIVVDVDGGGASPTFFNGVPTVFTAYEGPDTGYVAANYQGGTGGVINHWLISPEITVGAGDTLCFYNRAPDGSSWPDSISVRYSPTAGTTPADFTVEWEYFEVPLTWTQWAATFPNAGTIRFAFNYLIYDNVTNSNFIGIDYIQVKEAFVVPVELTAFTANIIGESIVLNWVTATETNNLGFRVERSADGINFTEIGFVDGNGTTAESSEYSFVDNTVSSGSYSYRLKQVDFDGSYEYSAAVSVELTRMPTEYVLAQNFPNPFNPTTAINFSLPEAGNVKLTVFNTLGQEVSSLLNSNFEAGNHSVNFDASSLHSGVYYYRIEANNFVQVRKMMLVK